MTPSGPLAEVLALPREAGTEEATRARELLRDHLTGLGYEVSVQRFGFSDAALRAFPLFGAGLGWLTLLQIPLLATPAVPAWAALALWGAGLAALVLLVAGTGLGWMPGGGPQREDANLVATRPGGVVRRWIVAHADTKAQGHSMAGRLVAVWTVIAAILALTALAALRLQGPLPLTAVAAGAGLAVAAGFLAGRGRLRGRSLGARDNGTGLVAALAAAAASQDPSVGILITGAEEFGLVGARIFAATTPERLAGTEVVNLDTLDDTGRLYVVSHDGPGHGLAARETARLTALGLSLTHRRLPLGIFVDSHPLGRGGAAAVTLGRLDWSTLRLIHTARDTPDGLRFETAERVGRAVAGVI